MAACSAAPGLTWVNARGTARAHAACIPFRSRDMATLHDWQLDACDDLHDGAKESPVQLLVDASRDYELLPPESAAELGV